MKKTLLFLMLAFCSLAFAQKVTLKEGSFDFLKGEKNVNVRFAFNDVKFYKENMSEQAYIEKRKKEISENKNEDEFTKWHADWERTKSTQIPDKFLASFNKYGDIRASQGSNEKYTVVVETTWIYPGWFAGVMNQPSKVSTLLKFVETQNPSNVLAVVESVNAPGDNFVGLPNNNDRIAEAYAKTSKELVQFMRKKMK